MIQTSPAPPKQDRPTAELSRGPRIGILGHVGNQNLGDEAIIAAVIQNVRRRWPGAEILGFTIVPGDTEQRHGIRSYPIRRGSGTKSSPAPQATAGSRGRALADSGASPTRARNLLKTVPILAPVARGAVGALRRIAGVGEELAFLRDSRRSIEGLDLLIFAGSHQLNDYVGGPWAFPYTVLKWSRLARSAGAKVVFLSLGAGPINTWLGRRFLRSALESASYRSYRDTTGKRAVESVCPVDADKVVPDLAFSLDLPPPAPPAPGRARRVVGINPLPLYTRYWHTHDEDKYAAYVGKLARFADWLVARDYEVRFIPTQLRVDPGVIDDVMARMGRVGAARAEGRVVAPRVAGLDDLLDAISGLDVMVATRYHGIVLALALQKPVLAIAYHQKSRDVMSWLGLGDYVVEGESFDDAALTARFESLEVPGASIVDSLGRKIPEFRSAVQAQYDEVFRILEGAPAPSRG